MTTTPTTPAKPAKSHRKPWAIIATAIASLLVGVGIGGSGDSPSPSAATPAVTVTAQATPGAVKTIEVPGPTKTVTRSNPTCLTALTKADSSIKLLGEGYGYASDAFGAMAELDITAMEESRRELEALTPNIKTQLDAYKVAREACRAS